MEELFTIKEGSMQPQAKFQHQNDPIGVLTESFTPREYQVKLLDDALSQNTIVVLGTGTGKTFIAVMLIRELAHEVRGPYDGSGRRTIFLVPTIPLVHQQANVLKQHTDLKVGEYIGSMDVDSWSQSMWLMEFQTNHILVMTAEIFRIILHHGFMPLSKVNLLIFDECHRAVKDYPYAGIMQCFDNCTPETRPRILGLTATLLNGKCKPSVLEHSIENLEKMLMSTAVTASDVDSLGAFGTKPKEICVIFHKNLHKEAVQNLISIIEGKLKHLNLPNNRNADDGWEKPMAIVQKRLQSVITTIQTLGPWCALKCIELMIQELEKLEVLIEPVPDIQAFLREFKTNFLTEIHSLTNRIFEGKDANSSLMWLLPPQLERLLELFVAFNRTYNQNGENGHEQSKVSLCSIVFVERKLNAHFLNLWLAQVSAHYPEYSFLRNDYIVGHGTEQGLNETTISMSSKQQQHVLFKFRQKECNVLIATSVMEEGMDVPHCNLVIRFDLPNDFRSYVQSKGRARARKSWYVMMIENDEETLQKFYGDLNNYRTIEEILVKKCHDREMPTEEDIEEHREERGVEQFMPHKVDGGARITMSNAIALINRYCASLPCDAFTKLTAEWKMKEVMSESPVPLYQCSIQLPINSSLREVIEGEPKSTKYFAKSSAALAVCRHLYEIGELNEHLVPITKNELLADDVSEDDEQIKGGAGAGTPKRRQVYSKKVADVLQGQLPQPGVPCYLYYYHMKLTCPITEEQNTRGRKLHDPADTPRCLGILITKRLPPINSFPVFVHAGEVTVDLRFCALGLTLTSEQVTQLNFFHRYLFDAVLNLENDMMTFDPVKSRSSYYVVPVMEGKEGDCFLDWAFIEYICREGLPALQPRTDNQRRQFIFKEEKFKDAVVIPAYLEKTDVKYHYVVEIFNDMTPASSFPKGPYTDFSHYYRDKYKIQLFNMSQPLLEVTCAVDRHSQLKSRYMSIKGVSLQASSEKTKEAKRQNLDRKLFYIPELCVIHPIPASLWMKIQSLPCMLFRTNHLLLADEVRQMVARETGIGRTDLPPSFRWPQLTFEYEDNDTNDPRFTTFDSDVQLDWENHPGPSPAIILQAMTTKKAGDGINLERLETIGDSFLKYAVTTYLFCTYPNHDEGKLTVMRMKQIRNKNLYKLGKRKGWATMMNTKVLDRKLNWVPPCYVVSPDAHIMLPENFAETDDSADKNPLTPSTYNSYTQHYAGDKAIADCVEALIGAYLLHCGPKNALRFMSWLGLTVLPKLTHKDMAEQPSFPEYGQLKVPESQIIQNLENPAEELEKLLSGYCKTVDGKELFSYTEGYITFEERLGYTFRNQFYIAEAFTHPSYRHNRITDCYQRLEFLGDAILDYVITSHLFKDPKKHSPGMLTDLRCALVNNTTFAKLAVMNRYHLFFRYLSNTLFGIVRQFVDATERMSETEFREAKLLEEEECDELEEIEVPKPLGDIFESIAGAIFLDSGMSLDTVWNVYYNIMKPTIDYVCKHCPKTPVRELMELKPSCVHFLPPEIKTNKVRITVEVKGTGKFVGIGRNRLLAKTAAAKRALRELK